MSYYGYILLGTIVGPLALSFDKKIRFIQYWKPLLISILSVAVVFILWDYWFEGLGIWGFTDEYVGTIRILNLPIEEILFFILVPFACMFIYEVVKGYLPDLKLELFGRALGFLLGLSGLIIAMVYSAKWYTLLASSVSSLLVIGLCFQLRVKWFGHFALAFLICLIPFFVVNGLLTGMATEEPVVWYNEDHIIGFRLGTIPIEDLYYNCCLLLPTVAIYERLKQRKTKNAPTE